VLRCQAVGGEERLPGGGVMELLAFVGIWAIATLLLGLAIGAVLLVAWAIFKVIDFATRARRNRATKGLERIQSWIV
jgi:uncharacterized membrane protein